MYSFVTNSLLSYIFHYNNHLPITPLFLLTQPFLVLGSIFPYGRLNSTSLLFLIRGSQTDCPLRLPLDQLTIDSIWSLGNIFWEKHAVNAVLGLIFQE